VWYGPRVSLKLFAESYRALKRVDWEIPPGVCVLVGPNGSGKTTLLDLPELLRHAIERGMQRAIEHHGGPAWIRHRGADPIAPLVVGCEVDGVRWEIDLSPTASSGARPTETVSVGGETLAVQSTHEVHFKPAGGGIVRDSSPLPVRIAGDARHAELVPMLSVISDYRLYGRYLVDELRRNGSQHSSDISLHVTGKNVFTVLRNWRDRRETRPRWDFVIESLKRCFPEVFAGLDFDVAGQVVTGRILSPRFDDAAPVHLAPDGWFTGLLHLCAVASATPHGLVGIDEPENALHPFAIRGLLDAMSDWAHEQGIRVLLATHSPVILDQLRSTPERVFVMEPGVDKLPARLDEVHSRDWLAHFSLGDLYVREQFGAQDPAAR
jgi:predicted ATPase